MLFRAKLDKVFFSEPPALDFRYYLNNIIQHEECTFFIESLSTLKNLLAEKSIRKENPVLRFLVDLDGTAWFARETYPGIQAPKHFQMTGESQQNASCRTAGNIKFTRSDCSVLKTLNHRSGDFQPSFHSLRLFIAILVLNEERLPFKLPRILVVKELNNNGDVAYKHKWPVVQIREWILSFIDNEDLVMRLKKQDAGIKKVHYKAHINELCNEV
ncbi:MAG: hypothetical protein HYX60_06880 [Legionella longbeachae]|nr:hypothetical protein [Legionella longbeachae]